MTNYNKGRIPRSVTAAIFAVAATLMMLAVPMATVVDTDATFANDTAGYCIKMVDPTDEEIDKYNVFSKGSGLTLASEIFLKIFDLTIFDLTEVVTGSYKYDTAMGSKYEARAIDQSLVYEVYATEVKLVYTAQKDGKLINSADYGPEYKTAAEAYAKFFGESISKGDRITVTGKITCRSASYLAYDYAAVDENHSVVTQGVNTEYFIYDIDVRIGLLRAGEEVGKLTSFQSNSKFMAFNEVRYDYHGTPYSQLTKDSPVTITFGKYDTSFVSGGSHYSVDGADYNVKYVPADSRTQETTAQIETDSNMNLDTLKELIWMIPASSGNVTVGKSYQESQEPYDAIVVEVVGQEIADLLMYLAIGFIILLVVVIVIVLVIRQKKKV
jgi:hypothetical protein